jgi:diguanylate cyclase (GGDEF)-like protein/PAS domain S-box-containing protein
VNLLQIEQCCETLRCLRHHAWSAPGVPLARGLDGIEGKDLAADGFKDWAEKAARGEIIIGAAKDFEPSIRKVLESDGVCSLVVVPVFADGRLWGQIGFDDCKAVRKWHPGEIDALRTLAEVLGTAAAQAHTLTQLADAKRIIETSPTIVFRLDARPPFGLQYISPNIEHYGYSMDDLLAGRPHWGTLVEAEDAEAVEKAIRSIVQDGADDAATEFRITRPDGSRVWFGSHARPFRDHDGLPIAIEGVMTDITERKQSALHVERLARTDTLTGLANRNQFMDKLADACNGASGDNATLAVHFMDLDYFKEVNDTLGHPIGDELLKAVAHRLKRSVRKGDVVARFGGDEFAILQIGLPSAEVAEAMAGKIRKQVGEPYKLSGNKVSISASIGLDCQAAAAAQPQDMLARADTALYQAKQDGRDRVCVYHPSLGTASGTALASNLRSAPAA